MIDHFQPGEGIQLVATIDDAGLATVSALVRAAIAARTDRNAADFRRRLDKASLDALERLEQEVASEQERRLDLVLASFNGSDRA